MKAILISFVGILVFGFSAQAQTEFGLKAGASFPSYKCADSEVLGETKSLTSFYLAGYLDTRIASGLYFQPEVSLQGKGSKLVESQERGAWQIEQKTKWLDFAFNFLGKVPIGQIGKVFVGAGPYIGFAMDGINEYAEKGTTTAVIIYDDNAMRSFDYGVNALTGIKFAKRFSVTANYRMGMANIAESAFKWSDNVKNRVFSVGVGVGL
ncbi:outer membrane beta-barrel protein [Sphingobacterium yanglingense]|uniref:Outer membrane protein with beta-barrel domain n=1 Tax=Sphingobacterium yanglingense TaxID=1437280 RepID=A0A4V3DDY4_9SPHI|nr:outer membrane beta-barrel protein [Sphingobacterium yanglingense]TDQ77818.1 outer membrane protein with beta-barrel domain [Sphingobacterium yanglingense]